MRCVNLPLTFLKSYSKTIARNKSSHCHYNLSDSVAQALNGSKPVIALESTILTHGLPKSSALRLAKKCHAICRSNNVIPATCAMMNGIIHVGLTDDQITELLDTPNLTKLSTRDLGIGISNKCSGGFTVASTLQICENTGINIFATGGIGGVHRGWAENMDISADLFQLSRTKVAVIAAGCKSVLDVPATLEMLESLGVPVITFGKTDHFPAFYTRTTGRNRLKSSTNTCNVEELSSIVENHWSFCNSGILVANPVPAEFELDADMVEKWIADAMSLAKSEGISGKDVTPFLLSQLKERSEGATLETNEQLVYNNVRLACQLALEMTSKHDKSFTIDCSNFQPEVLVIGSANLDINCKSDITMNEEHFRSGATVPGQIRLEAGGVGRNVSDCLTRLGIPTLLHCAIGQDPAGQIIRSLSKHIRIKEMPSAPNDKSACFVVNVNGDGSVLYDLGEANIIQNIFSDEKFVSNFQSQLEAKLTSKSKPRIVVMDGNIPTSQINFIAQLCKETQTFLVYEPTAAMLVTKPFQTGSLSTPCDLISPNLGETLTLLRYFAETQPEFASLLDELSSEKSIEEVHDLFDKNASLFLSKVPYWLFKFGGKGSIFLGGDSDLLKNSPSQKSSHFCVCVAAENYANIVSSNGAGDCLLSGLLAGLLRGNSLEQSFGIATKVVAKTLQSHLTVSPDIGPSDLVSEKVGLRGNGG